MPRKNIDIAEEVYDRLSKLRQSDEKIGKTLDRILAKTIESENENKNQGETSTNAADKDPMLFTKFTNSIDQRPYPPDDKIIDKERIKRRYWQV